VNCKHLIATTCALKTRAYVRRSKQKATLVSKFPKQPLMHTYSESYHIKNKHAQCVFLYISPSAPRWLSPSISRCNSTTTTMIENISQINPQLSSPLLSLLPAEIRHEIWTHIFSNLSIPLVLENGRLKIRGSLKENKLFSLPLACRQT
jgi:hypothetical protein